MTVIDFHPDELLDRSLRGELSSDERAHLVQHLAQCAACRFEQLLRDDFAAETSEYEEAGALHALVSGALLAVEQPRARAALPAAPAVAVSSGRKPRRHASILLVAAAVFLLSGVAAAQIGLIEQAVAYVRARAPHLLAPRAALAPRARRTHDETGEGDARRTGQPVPSAVTLEAAQQTTAASAPSAAPSESVRASHGAAANTGTAGVSGARLAPSRSRATVAPRATAGPRVQVGADAEPTSRPAEAEKGATGPDAGRYADSPALLFERANSLRRQGRASEAMALYRELGLRFAQHPEGRLALALLARLELDQADPAAALREFEAYLATGDQALSEQALAGRALALGQLGRQRAQCAAFEALLRTFPSSSYAQLARHRCGRFE